MTSTYEILNRELSKGTRKPSVAVRDFIDRKKKFFLIKRIFDVSVSLFVSVFVMSWLFPLIAILIRLESSGPVLFIQRRVGMGGKTFRCLKFRTMVVNSEANLKQAQINDRRITRVGNFLRVSNLDEFPQFFNVLMGDMSIVGPRPHMHSDCSKFSSVVSNYKLRNMVKPGITGLAQVKGYRGPTKDFKSIFHRYQFDAFYVRNANFWLDLRIIRKTAFQTFKAIWDRISFPVSVTPHYPRKWVAAFRSFLS
jgi:putative colanic acid biosynthesis UDP-glucose lipid carrier transferase